MVGIAKLPLLCPCPKDVKESQGHCWNKDWEGGQEIGDRKGMGEEMSRRLPLLALPLPLQVGLFPNISPHISTTDLTALMMAPPMW